MGRSSPLAVAGALLAVEDAGFQNLSKVVERMSVIIGSAVSGLEYAEPDFRMLEKDSVRRMRPYLGIAGFGGAISSEVSRALKITNFSLIISTGCNPLRTQSSILLI